MSTEHDYECIIRARNVHVVYNSSFAVVFKFCFGCVSTNFFSSSFAWFLLYFLLFFGHNNGSCYSFLLADAFHILKSNNINFEPKIDMHRYIILSLGAADTFIDMLAGGACMCAHFIFFVKIGQK